MKLKSDSTKLQFSAIFLYDTCVLFFFSFAYSYQRTWTMIQLLFNIRSENVQIV